VLRPGSLGDSDGLHTGRVVQAYLTADRARAFRQLIWRQTATIGVLGSAIAATTALISPAGLARGVIALVMIAGAAAVWEWRTSRTLAGLLDR
jgi:hypothetical protein